METISVGKGSVSGESSEDCPVYQGFDSRIDEQVRGLARKLTQSSNINQHLKNDANDNDEVDDIQSFNQENFGAVSSSSLKLLRTLTSMSQVPGVNPVDSEIDPRLDPDSDDFDAKFWVKNMRKLVDTDTDYYKPTSLGFAFNCKRYFF